MTLEGTGMNQMQNEVANVIEGMLASSNMEADQAYGLIKDSDALARIKQSIHEMNPGHFHSYMTYPVERVTCAMLRAEGVAEPKAVFLLTHYRFVEVHFKQLIDKFEGMACCSDRSRTIVRRLLRFLMTGERIEFDYSGKYTFHLPVKIFKTHEAILEYFEALLHLHSGRPELYLLVLFKMMKCVDGDSEIAEPSPSYSLLEESVKRGELEMTLRSKSAALDLYEKAPVKIWKVVSTSTWYTDDERVARGHQELGDLVTPMIELDPALMEMRRRNESAEFSVNGCVCFPDEADAHRRRCHECPR